MLKTEQLRDYLNEYKNLPIHQDESLKRLTLSVMDWQKQRMQLVHPNIFKQKYYHAISLFFFHQFYNFDAVTLLAEHLELALNKKIKLDKWIPEEVLSTILNGFNLALITLKADMQLATALNAKNLSATTPHLLQIAPQLAQTQVRQQQLDLLLRVSTNLYKFSHSFLLRSAFKIAQPKFEQRGFISLSQYVENGIKAMRSNKKSLLFFKQLTHQENIFIQYINIQNPTALNLYYDSKSDAILSLKQAN